MKQSSVFQQCNKHRTAQNNARVAFSSANKNSTAIITTLVRHSEQREQKLHRYHNLASAAFSSANQHSAVQPAVEKRPREN
jgi:hypothetical protein